MQWEGDKCPKRFYQAENYRLSLATFVLRCLCHQARNGGQFSFFFFHRVRTKPNMLITNSILRTRENSSRKFEGSYLKTNMLRSLFCIRTDIFPSTKECTRTWIEKKNRTWVHHFTLQAVKPLFSRLSLFPHFLVTLQWIQSDSQSNGRVLINNCEISVGCLNLLTFVREKG